jgi:hypothetical protein
VERSQCLLRLREHLEWLSSLQHHMRINSKELLKNEIPKIKSVRYPVALGMISPNWYVTYGPYSHTAWRWTSNFLERTYVSSWQYITVLRLMFRVWSLHYLSRKPVDFVKQIKSFSGRGIQARSFL